MTGGVVAVHGVVHVFGGGDILRVDVPVALHVGILKIEEIRIQERRRIFGRRRRAGIAGTLTPGELNERVKLFDGRNPPVVISRGIGLRCDFLRFIIETDCKIALPHQPRYVVRDRAVVVISITRLVSGIVRVLSLGLRVALGLVGVNDRVAAFRAGLRRRGLAVILRRRTVRALYVHRRGHQLRLFLADDAFRNGAEHGIRALRIVRIGPVFTHIPFQVVRLLLRQHAVRYQLAENAFQLGLPHRLRLFGSVPHRRIGRAAGERASSDAPHGKRNQKYYRQQNWTEFTFFHWLSLLPEITQSVIPVCEACVKEPRHFPLFDENTNQTIVTKTKHTR